MDWRCVYGTDLAILCDNARHEKAVYVLFYVATQWVNGTNSLLFGNTSIFKVR